MLSLTLALNLLYGKARLAQPPPLPLNLLLLGFLGGRSLRRQFLSTLFMQAYPVSALGRVR